MFLRLAELLKGPVLDSNFCPFGGGIASQSNHYKKCCISKKGFGWDHFGKKGLVTVILTQEKAGQGYFMVLELSSYA